MRVKDPIQPDADCLTEIFEAPTVSAGQHLRLEFPDLERFNGAWYCSFREALSHYADATSKGRVLRSTDGKKWETVAVLSNPEPDGDIREPRLSITADGRLMAMSTLGYETPGAKLQEIDGEPRYADNAIWLSSDGQTWEGPFIAPELRNSYHFDQTWHDGWCYSVGYYWKDMLGTLYRSRDGKSWEVVAKHMFPERRGNEGTLAFGRDGTMHALLRGAGGGRIALGCAAPPFTDWKWREVDFLPCGERDRKALGQVVHSDFAGPNLIALRDGRLLAAAYFRQPVEPPPRISVFLVHPGEALLEEVVALENLQSYPGLVEHDGSIFFTAATVIDIFRIQFGSFPCPPEQGLPTLSDSDRNARRRAQELAECDDPARLEQAAVEDPDWRARLAAVERVSNPEVLTRALTADAAWSVRAAARPRLQGAVNFGEWFFRTDPDDEGQKLGWQRIMPGDRGWAVLPVPALWRDTRIGSAYLGVGWYLVDFTLPSDPANQQLRLVFEGVDAQAWVYVNGEQAGEQSSAATGLPPDELWDDPFAVVVSGAKLRYPDPNLLAVRVQAGPCNGGIYEAVIASLEPAR